MHASLTLPLDAVPSPLGSDQFSLQRTRVLPSPVTLKPPPDRLYGRIRGHALRPRQERLLRQTLPRMQFTNPTKPASGFAAPMREIWLEVGFGGGEHALAQAAANPDIGLIACEVFENGICSLLTQLVPDGAEDTAPVPPNLRIWPDDARALIRQLPDACLSRLFLLFPDPWPKARHAKRRFLHPALLPDIARVLRPGGDWRIASDDPTYQTWVSEVMTAQNCFTPQMREGERPANWPSTRYERKALLNQRSPIFWRFTRSL